MYSYPAFAQPDATRIAAFANPRAAPRHREGLLRDLQLLVGGHHQHRHPAVVRRHRASSGTGRGVASRVEAHPVTLQAGAHPRADLRVVLPDPGGEHDRVDPAEGRRVGPEVAADPIAEDVQRLGRVGVPVRDPAPDLPHVAGSGQPGQAALLGQQGLDLLEVQARLAVQVEHHGRVDVAAAGAHDQPGQRGQAHRGVDAPAAVDGGRAGPVAQVQGDQCELLDRAAEVLGRPPGDVLVRGAVEAEPPDPVAVGQRPGQRVPVGAGRHGPVERGVEHRDLRQCGVQPAGDLDAQRVGRIVQRGQRGQLADRGQHAVVDQHRSVEPGAAVHHPVPDSGQVVGHPGLLEGVQHPAEPGLVVRDRLLDHQVLPAGRAVPQRRPVATDPVQQAGREHLAVRAPHRSSWYLMVDEPVLMTRTGFTGPPAPGSR